VAEYGGERRKGKKRATVGHCKDYDMAANCLGAGKDCGIAKCMCVGICMCIDSKANLGGQGSCKSNGKGAMAMNKGGKGRIPLGTIDPSFH
jgi:hypothetical protein